MPKNLKGGNKAKSQANKKVNVKRNTVYASEDEKDKMTYGKIVKKLGGLHLEIKCIDSISRIGKIRGRMAGKQWINISDVVLVSLRDFGNDTKCDILYCYNADEVESVIIRLQKQKINYKVLTQDLEHNTDKIIENDIEFNKTNDIHSNNNLTITNTLDDITFSDNSDNSDGEEDEKEDEKENSDNINNSDSIDNNSDNNSDEIDKI